MGYAIVITGAPASGKSACLRRLRIEPDFVGFTFFDELARKLLAANPAYRQDWELFHRDIYYQQIKRESELTGQSFITDRGTIDAFAFHPETAIIVGTTIENEYKRYSGVIQLGSAANLGTSFYQTDDIRLESCEQALEIEQAIRKVWENHPNYHYLPAEANFEYKYKNFFAIARNLCDHNINN